MYSLYLVTSQKVNFSKIEAAVQGGVTIVQLRQKDISCADYIALACKTKELLAPYHIPLIINDDPMVAKESGADGVHLGQCDFSVEAAREILGERVIIGLSVESDEQVKATLPVDYFSASPIFSSTTKLDTAPPIGIEGVKRLRSLTSKPLVAIGGINESNVVSVLETGVDGVCVISAILDAQDSYYAARTFYQKISEHKKRYLLT